MEKHLIRDTTKEKHQSKKLVVKEEQQPYIKA